MENMTSAQLAQLLYVAYYGRPADPAGLEFWTAQIDEVGVEGIAADFGTSAEFDARFGDLGSVALVNNLYQQLFGRDAEAEGLQYWLDVLAEGTPLASIALEIANGAQGGDATGLQNKVTLAGQFTAAVAAGSVVYEGEAAANYGRDFLATINENTNVEAYDVQAVVDAIESGELPVDLTDLRVALNDLQAAEQAKIDFLEGVDNEAVLEEAGDGATTAQIETAIGTVNTANITALEAADDSSAINSANFGNLSVTAQDALIADAVATAEEAVTTAEGNVENGVIAALTTVQTRATALEAAIDAQAAAQVEFDGEKGRFDAVNGTTAAIDLGAGTITVGGDQVAEQRADGSFRLIDQQDVDLSTLEGFDALLADASALGLAEVASANARTALESALVDVVELEEDLQDQEYAALEYDGTATPPSGSVAYAEGTDADGNATVDVTFYNDSADVETLLTARESLEDLNDAVADFEAVRDIAAELEGLDDTIEAAEEAVADLDVTLITADTPFGDASAENDVYAFSDAVANDTTIGDFGAEGVDRLYFGQDYSLVQLADGEAIEDNVGASDALEVFWDQVGTDLVLYVETETFGGNSTTLGDITEITLTGVNAEDITFSGGFLSAGTASTTEVA